MKLWNKLMELHCSRYLGYPLEIVSIDKNHNIIDTITYTLGENMDVFRSLGEKLQWEVVETKYFFCDLTITIKKESKEMKDYTVSEARDIICRYFVMRGTIKHGAKELRCSGIGCSGCVFNTKNGCGFDFIDNEYLAKAEEELNKADCECEVDWSKVKVDTKILVRDYEQADWVKRYFAKYENERVCAWTRGGTSWSAGDKGVRGWDYAELAEEEEND